MVVHICVVVMLSFDHAYIYTYRVKLSHNSDKNIFKLQFHAVLIVVYIIISGPRIICEIILL